MDAEAQARIARRLRRQADGCYRPGGGGSPLYAMLLRRASEDVLRGGPVWDVLAGHDLDPPGSSLALRFLGAVHRLVLRGDAPRLARHYPSAGGSPGPDAWDDFAATVATHAATLRREVEEPVQTNEAGRSTALVGAFLEVARAFGLPLQILEIGASAGLNLRWDHYRYEARGMSWGDPRSPLRLCDYAPGARPPFEVVARVVERRGSDPRPLDPTTADDRLKLKGFVWPDQASRLRLLENALAVAARVPAPIDRSAALPWVERQLAEPSAGNATVVFHSIVEQYMPSGDAGRLGVLLEDAGAKRGEEAPLAHVRMEEGDEREAEVTLQMWPGAGRVAVARCGYHGGSVRWFGYRP